jgi:hypothetical protein
MWVAQKFSEIYRLRTESELHITPKMLYPQGEPLVPTV